MMRFLLPLAAAASLAGVVAPSLEDTAPIIAGPPAPEMSKEGLELVLNYETGGRDEYLRFPHPEFIGDSGSGVTWGVGYDGHQNSRSNILKDWSRLGETPARRLAATQPFCGPRAKAPQQAVKDITVPWDDSVKVFLEVDLARTDAQCRRAFPGFDRLSLHGKDAIRSLVFNRGPGMAGPARVEMRAIRGMVPLLDYPGMAREERLMCHLWIGTPIEKGMTRRRYAEAELFLTPDL